MAPFFVRCATAPAGSLRGFPREMPDLPSPAPASPWERARAVLLASNIAWTTLCLGGWLPGTRAVTAALTAALLAVHFLGPERGTRAHPAGWLFIPFLVYGAWNAGWLSPVPWMGWNDWLGWLQMCGIYWVVLNGIESDGPVRFLVAAVGAVAVAASAMAVYQHFVDPRWLMLGRTQADQYIGRSSGSFGIPNSLGAMLALLLPPAGALALGRGRAAWVRAAALAALVLLAAAFVLAISRAAWIALAAALVLRAVFGPGRSAARRLAEGAAVVAATAGAVWILYVSFPLMRVRLGQLVTDAGERTRPVMWRGAWGIFSSHRVFGGGAGAFDVLFEAFRPQGYRDDPVYAHCDYLNTLCDYGLVGFVLLFGAAAVVAWRCAGARGLAGAAFTGLLAFALHLLVDWHLKMPALAIMVATVAALVTRAAWPPAPLRAAPGRAARAAAALAAASVLAAAALWVLPRYRSEEYRRRAGLDIAVASPGADAGAERAAFAAARIDLEQAINLDPRNAWAWADRSYLDSLGAFVDPARSVQCGVAAADDARRALAFSAVVPEFWVRLGVGLDMQRKWIEGGDCYVRALRLAPERADLWYYQAYHLSLNPVEAGPAAAAADYCLRLDPDFLLAQTLRHRLESRLQSRP